MSDYTAIQELLTRDIKLKTLELNNWLNLYCGNLFAKMRNKETKKQDVYYSYVQFYNPSMLL